MLMLLSFTMYWLIVFSKWSPSFGKRRLGFSHFFFFFDIGFSH